MLYFDYILYPYDILGSQAHVNMLAKQGLISIKEKDLIINNLNKIKCELDANQHIAALTAVDPENTKPPPCPFRRHSGICSDDSQCSSIRSP